MNRPHSSFLSLLPNRMAFNETTNKALLQAKRHQKKLALVLISVDNYQALKESSVPTKMKHILDELSQRLSSSLRESDVLGHLGKDEFALLLTDVEQTKWIGIVAEKILKAVDISLSIGISVFPDDGQTLEELQIQAANALEQSQRQGGGQYQFAHPQMTLESQHFSQLQEELHEALKQNEFILYYQPKLDLKAKTVCGVEALIRWKHPRLGLIDPLQFIPSAEETQIILSIGEWALREACLAAKRWQNKGFRPIPVAVNLSPKQFYHPQLSSSLQTILNETALEPCYLELEITEMTLMDDTARVQEIFKSLKKLGLSLTFDDFGTGHTSIRYLREFAIDSVKIDQSFIKSLPEDSKNAAITTSIIQLAHELGLQVVAEGVETPEQMQFLSELNCDQVQGYLISRPLPESRFMIESF